MFTYIYMGNTYTDASISFMQGLGMDEEQIESVRNQYEFERQQVSEKRKAAYKDESDHLFIKWQREQIPDQKQAWLDAVAAIQERYPHLPELSDEA